MWYTVHLKGLDIKKSLKTFVKKKKHTHTKEGHLHDKQQKQILFNLNKQWRFIGKSSYEFLSLVPFSITQALYVWLWDHFTTAAELLIYFFLI